MAKLAPQDKFTQPTIKTVAPPPDSFRALTAKQRRDRMKVMYADVKPEETAQ